MGLLHIYNDFCDEPGAARRAIFDAAIAEVESSGLGYNLSDILYELCEAQANIIMLEDRLDTLEARFDKKAKKKASDGL